jgi:hypothetical protein
MSGLLRVKTVTAPVEVKSSGPLGIASAVICTFHCVDRDGDWVLPSAFTPGQEIAVSPYGHSSLAGTSLPAGKATIRVTPTEAIADVEWFLMTSQGRDSFETVRALGGIAEWSWGFRVTESDYGPAPDGSAPRVQIIRKANIVECSPVLAGASINTRTIAGSAKEERIRQAALELRKRWLAGQGRSEADARAAAAVQRLRFIRYQHQRARAVA